LFHANVLAARAAARANVRRLCTGIRVADPRHTRTNLERWATASADRFVCVSQSVADFCLRRGFAKKKLVVIPNGIEMVRWKNAAPAELTQFGVPKGRRVIVYVGRLDRQKGLAEFFLQLKALFALAPGHDLLLVGDGPLREQLQQDARTQGLEQRVHFAGWQPDVPAILAAADLLVLPSLWEGMPNAVLEAMASGKPLVATRTEGVEELLGQAAFTQSVPIRDFDALYQTIVEIVNNPKWASELGQENQQRAERLFSLDSMVRHYENLFVSLVGN
jgi:glycosyltransferase involved in cell wall biosynthesis